MSDMLKPLITIIVPIYKAQKYVKHCVNSILKQSYDNFELLLIEDGSPDNSLKICTRLASQDNRIRVIHKENGGVSSARNRGIVEAEGEFIFFCDADDWIEKNTLEYLYDALKTGADFSYGKVTSVFGVKRTMSGPQKSATYSISEELFDCDAFEDLLNVIGPWGKLYKTSIIKEKNILFDEKIAYGEDRIFLWEYLKNCNKIVAVNENVYFYSQLNAGSACNKYYSDLPIWSCKAIDEFITLFTDFEYRNTVNQLISARIMNLMEYCVYQDLENLKGEEARFSLTENSKIFSKYLPYIEENIYANDKEEYRREKGISYLKGNYDIYIMNEKKESKIKEFIRLLMRKIQAYRIYLK